MSAVSADQKAGEHIALPLMGAALADLPPFLLDLLKDRPLNDGLMDVLEDDPVLPVILQPPLVLVRLGVGLEVEDVAAILLQGQELGNGETIPLRCGLLFPFPWPLDTFFEPVGARGQDTCSRCAAICSVPCPSSVMR